MIDFFSFIRFVLGDYRLDHGHQKRICGCKQLMRETLNAQTPHSDRAVMRQPPKPSRDGERLLAPLSFKLSGTHPDTDLRSCTVPRARPIFPFALSIHV